MDEKDFKAMNKIVVKQKNTPEELADKWIAELTEAGCSHDEMLSIFELARQKFNEKKLVFPPKHFDCLVRHSGNATLILNSVPDNNVGNI